MATPLWPSYRRELESTVADLKNKPSDAGAIITAAMFLGEFTGELPWAYLDLGETAWAGRRWDVGEAGDRCPGAHDAAPRACQNARSSPRERARVTLTFDRLGLRSRLERLPVARSDRRCPHQDARGSVTGGP